MSQLFCTFTVLYKFKHKITLSSQSQRSALWKIKKSNAAETFVVKFTGWPLDVVAELNWIDTCCHTSHITLPWPDHFLSPLPRHRAAVPAPQLNTDSIKGGLWGGGSCQAFKKFSSLKILIEISSILKFI